MRNARALTMMAIAVILAFAAVIVAARWINAQASGTINKVAVAQIDISLGARITPDMVRMVDWPSNALPPVSNSICQKCCDWRQKTPQSLANLSPPLNIANGCKP